MVHLSNFGCVVTALFSVRAACTAASSTCRATPGSQDWPSNAEWAGLNRTVSGRLIKAVPPAAACHSNYPEYNNATCAYIVSAWGNSTFHDADPVSVDINNWTGDCCLPSPLAPCSGEGYPVYVINATSPAHVKAGVDFARERNVRLIVKSSGHDYLGRSVAPNSLSIWTHFMKDKAFHETFTPKGCKECIDTKAMTLGAGSQMIDIYPAAAQYNVTIVGGMDMTVSLGGYLTAGGHSPLSTTYGLGADQILEMQVVTASGDILTVNECQNTDLFWALRGGGGASFGVVTSFTVKAFPSPSVAEIIVEIGAAVESDAFWNTMAYIVSDTPRLSDTGVSGYTYFVRRYNATFSGYSGFYFAFNATTDELVERLAPIEEYINATWPGQVLVAPILLQQHPDFLSWWITHIDPTGNGVDEVLGSRLLDKAALSQPLDVIENTLKKAVPIKGVAISHLVAGKGVHNVVPQGGSDAVNPAWRKAYAHFVAAESWTPLNDTEKAEAINDVNNVEVQALREFDPSSGAYLNEAYADEPNYQQAFWGTNYPRLLKIKQDVDPGNVFWCHPCVGDEGWTVVGDRLCSK